MNVVREINKINQRELDLGISGSWHDDYKDSAYIFVGGLHSDLTEGDVITIFSQYGEVMDVNLPRDKNTGKTRGFGFLMYEDQRSTVLAVDNLNGAKVLERILRVDHVKDYKQPKVKGEDGELADREEQSLNAKPEVLIDDDAASDSSESDSGPPIDPEDPMYDYLVAKRIEEKALKKAKKSKAGKGKGKHKDETPEERHARKARKRARKAQKLGKSEGMRGVEELLNSLQGRPRQSVSPGRRPGDRVRGRSPRREQDYASARRYSPERETGPRDGLRAGEDRYSRRIPSRSRSPGMRYRDDRRASAGTAWGYERDFDASRRG